MAGVDDERLKALLSECTVPIEGKMRGTAFFIDEDLLLTCAHVGGVEGDTVKVFQLAEEPLTAKVVRATSVKDGDVALLRLEGTAQDAVNDCPRPSALLSAVEGRPTTFWAAGYPRIDRPPELPQVELLRQCLPYEGRLAEGVNAPEEILINAGEEVENGLSGGPLADASTGMVIGIVQYKRTTSSGLGGSAIPIQVAAQHLREVARRLRRPPAPTHEWREMVGIEDRWDTTLDIEISGGLKAWTVRYEDDENDDEKHEWTLSSIENFSDALPEALFGWVRHQHPREKTEVARCGRLLARALFPDTLGDRVRALGRRKATARVRLSFGAESDALAEVPWEYVTIPGSDDFLATTSPFELTRVIRDHSVPGGLEPQTRIALLAVIPDSTPTSPSSPTVADTLAACKLDQLVAECDSVRNSPDVIRVRTFHSGIDDLSGLVGQEVTVLHYIGMGRYDRTQQLLLDSPAAGVDWVDIDEFFKVVASLQPRLLVCQLISPPSHLAAQSLPPGWCLPALKGRVTALVFTQSPMSAMVINVFNETFYKALARGATIEAAVRQARNMARIHTGGDPGAFGAIAAVTGADGGGQLLTAPVAADGGWPAGAGGQAGPDPRRGIVREEARERMAPRSETLSVDVPRPGGGRDEFRKAAS